MKDLIGNCPLCEERALHIAGTEEAQVMQCINCGYTTSTKYTGTKEKNEEFKKLGEDMKTWAVEKNGKIWIPSVIALPVGMLYPVGKNQVDGIGEVGDTSIPVMKWGFAPMVEIPEEERKKYPNPNVPGKFYDKKVDIENTVVYDTFLEGMSSLNELLKKQSKVD